MEEKIDGVLARLSEMFERWLTEFEARPLRAGLKVLIVFIALRWVWRSLK